MGPTDNLLSELANWARERRILPEEFACAQYEQCQESRRRRNLPLLDGGKTCTMSYIGRQYGASVAGRTFRLVIVGLDNGDPDSGNFVQRQEGFEDWYYKQQEDFNQHYAGVIRTAAAVWGQAGRHCWENCWKNGKASSCAGEKRLDGAKCVLLSFAQPNLVKCVSAPDRDCRATVEMFRYCSRHLVNELNILKPDLVVFHGAPAKWSFPLAIHDEGYKITPVLDGPTDDSEFPVIQQLAAPNFGCIALFLAHPSRGHLERQWKPVVEQALEFLRSRNAIPS